MEENQNFGIPSEGMGVQTNSDEGVSITNNYSEGVTTQAVYTQLQEPINEVQEEAQAVNQPPVQAQPQTIIQEVTPMEGNGFKVKTSLLKEALKKADVVASKVELDPITEVVMFRVVGNVLQVRSTDRENILTVNVPVIQATDGTIITLKISDIKPLIDRLNSEEVTVVADNLVAKVSVASGEYNYNQAIDLTTNSVIVLPDIDKDSILINETVELDKSQFLPHIESVYPIISGLPNTSALSAIHFGEFISATTGDNIAVVRENLTPLFRTTAFIKSSTIKDIISMGTDDKIRIGFGQLNGIATMCIYSGEYRLYSVLKEEESEYPITEISDILNSNKGTTIKLNKASLLGSIDRLTLFFISSVVRQILDFEITNGVLKVSNESKAFETLPVSSTNNLKIKFDVKDLVTILKALKTDDVIIEPIVNGDEPVTHVQISDGNKNAYVIGVAI